MRFRVTAVLAILVVGCVASAQHHVPDEILVKYQADESLRARVLAVSLGARPTERNPLGVTKFKLPPNANAMAAAAQFRALPDVVFAEPNYIVHTAFTPNDPRYANQYAPKRIAADFGWDVIQGSANVKIAILDTGVDVNHADLSLKLVPGYNFISNNTNTNDDHGHGTHCAGIAAAATNNGIGIAGIGFNSSIMPVKVLSSSGSGSSSGVSNGIIWAADNGAQVISLSLGSTSFSETMRDAVTYAWSKGSIVVGAAGNNNNDIPFYPAAYEHAVAVGSTDWNDQKSSFSNYGSWVDVAAPGTSIDSTLRGGGYGTMSGTSMAAPHVAGQAALIWAQLGAGTSVSMIRNKIESTTDPVGTWVRTGRVNVAKSVEVPLEIRKDFFPVAVTVTTGTRLSGSFADLAVSDDRRYIAGSKKINSTTERIVWWSRSNVSYSGSLLALEIALEQNSSHAGSGVVAMYNFTTAKWVKVLTTQVGTSDTTAQFAITSSPLSYISSTGDVRVRVTLNRSTTTAFTTGVDLVRVTTVAR